MLTAKRGNDPGRVLLRFVLPVFWVSCMVLSVRADPPAAGNWQLVWSDEFESGSTPEDPSTTNWGREIGYVRNREWQYYTNSQQNAYCRDGMLHIEAHRHSAGTCPAGSAAGQDGSISSASLTTQGKVEFRYGWLEMRARIDVQYGSWPAFWTLGTDGEWPDNGECDIMEYYQNRLHFNVAWWLTGDTRWTARWDTATASLSRLGSGWADEFHIWAMEWTPFQIKLYLDGILYNTWSCADDIADSSLEGFQQPHYILLNQAIGGTNGGDASSLTYPTAYQVDWVRWYQDTAAYTDEYIDDSDSSITYGGTWSTWFGNPSCCKTEHCSETAGSAAAVTFVGSKVWYYGHRRNDLGYAKILLDGQDVGTVDCYSSTTDYGVMLYESPQLSYGQHTLTVQVAGTKTQESSGTEVIVDAFRYSTAIPDTTAPAVPANLSAAAADGRIILDWDDNTEEDFAFYRIYRTTTAGVYSETPLGTVVDSYYGDLTAAGGTTYYYAVTSVDQNSNESGKSQDISAPEYPGDLTLDGRVDLGDIAALSSEWRDAYDMPLLLNIAQYWLETTNNAPRFTSTPILEAYALQGRSYSGTLGDDVVDADITDVLAFQKISGPRWLQVADNGDLSGVPEAADIGPNFFVVRVNDGRFGFDLADVEIMVYPEDFVPTIYVYDISVESRQSGVYYFGRAAVKIQDGFGAAASGAVVYGEWSGSVAQFTGDVTQADGTITFVSPGIRNGGTFIFTVTDIVKEGYVYAPASDLKSTERITVP